MSLTPDQLDNWTTYHQPTDETSPKYAAIREAEEAMHNAIFGEVWRFREARDNATTDAPINVPNYAVVNLAARAFLVAIDTHAPDSADKTAAFRCVRLARNAANEALSALPKEHNTPLHWWATVGTMEEEAHRQAILARFQANSAIACGGK